LTKEESTVPVKSVSINHNEDVPAAINFQSEAVVELQKLSLAGMCFIALTGLFFLITALLFCVRTVKSRKAIAAKLAENKRPITPRSKGKKNEPEPEVKLSPAEQAAKKAREALPPKAREAAEKAAAISKNLAANSNSLFEKVFTEDSLNSAEKTLALIPVFSILMVFIMFRAKEQQILGVAGDVAVTPPGEAYTFTQSFMLCGTLAIYLQALSTLDIKISSEVCGNLSDTLGTLFAYVGYGGIVYGALYARDMDKPLSVAAQCIIALTSLVFVLRIIVVYLQYRKKVQYKMLAIMSDEAAKAELQKQETAADKERADQDAANDAAAAEEAASEKDPLLLAKELREAPLVIDFSKVNFFDESKILKAEALCDNVPIVCLMFFYAHQRALEVSQGKSMIQEMADLPGEEQQHFQMCVLSMYGCVGGLFLDCLGVLVMGDLNKALGKLVRFAGVIGTYAGFAGVAYSMVHIMATKYYTGSMTTTPIMMCGLGLVFLAAIVKMCTVVIEECLSKQVPEEIKNLFKQFMSVIQKSYMVAMVLFYIHYRVFDTSSGGFFCVVDQMDKGTGYMFCGALALVVGGTLLEMLFLVMEICCPSALFMTFLKANTMVAVYVGFTYIMFTAFTLAVPTVSSTLTAAPGC
jgi:hypothetical protein